MSNEFRNVMDELRTQIKETEDVEKTLDVNCGRMLNALCSHPLDCGIKRFRGLVIQAPKPIPASSNGMRPDWMLIVKGTTEDGTDVISFIHAETPIAALLAFCYAVELDGVEWKEDIQQKGKRVDSKQAFASLVGNS